MSMLPVVMLPFRFQRMFYLEITRFPPSIPHLHLLSFTFHPLENFIQVYSIQPIGQDSENNSESLRNLDLNAVKLFNISL